MSAIISNTPGTLIITVTNKNCSTTNSTNAYICNVISNVWSASDSSGFTANGTGLTAAFTPPNCAHGTNTFTIVYNSSPCSAALVTNTVSGIYDAVSLQSVTVTNATQIDSTNWAAVKTTGTNTDYVYVTANVCPNLAEVTNLISISGGQAVSGNPFQRQVPKWISAETTVTVTGCTNTNVVKVWILWSTVQILTNGINPSNAPQFGVRFDGTEILGARTDDLGGIAWGKITTVAQITPTGVHNVITNGWVTRQERWFHEFKDGVQTGAVNDSAWTDDTADASNQNEIPDSNDNIYSIDAPDIFSAGATNCTEVYGNFHDWVEWNGTVASDGTPGADAFPAAAKWHWQGKWQSDANPQVVLEDVSGSYIVLPTTAQGCP